MDNTRDKENSLQKNMGRMLDLGLYSDIVLLVGPGQFRFNVHKVVLGGRSEVFATMFQSRWTNDHNESAKEVINLPNHSSEAFKTFLRFLYTDELERPENTEEALEILELSNFYQVPRLLNEIVEIIKEEINGSNCFEIYKRSRDIDEDLSQLSFQYFLKNIRTAAEGEQYLSWDAETVRNVLSQDILDIREIDLFKALLKWGNHVDASSKEGNVYPRSQALPELMKMIRFPAMGVKVFASEVVPTGVFSSDEVVQMFLHFSNPQQTPSNYDSSPRFKSEPHTPLPNFIIYPEQPVTNGHISPYTTTPQSLDQLAPEFRLQVSSPIFLRGIGIYPHELLGTLLNDYLALEFTLTIKSDGGIVAEKRERVSRNRIIFNIAFESPVTLETGKSYEFYVTCTNANDSLRNPSNNFDAYAGVVLYLRTQPGVIEENVRLADLGGGCGVQATFNFRTASDPHPQRSQVLGIPGISLPRLHSTWICSLLLSTESDNEPCLIV